MVWLYPVNNDINLTIISHHFTDKGCQILKYCDMQNFKGTLEIRLKVFDKIQVKVDKIKTPKRQSSIFNDSFFVNF